MYKEKKEERTIVSYGIYQLLQTYSYTVIHVSIEKYLRIEANVTPVQDRKVLDLILNDKIITEI